MTTDRTARLAALHAHLDEVLDLPAHERDERIAALRAADAPLAAELERMLAAEAGLDARRFLEERLEPLTSRRDPTGQELGGYTIERQLGHGGMGTVWLARRSDGRFEGRAAVKLLYLSLVDPAGARRFRREGTVLARLSHPNVARMLDAGVTDGGQPYLVLECVDGERIDDYCDRLRLPPEARIRLFLDVLAAVSHAHANLVVHRDIKPSNILVTGDGTVKLLDFGVARLLDAQAGPDGSFADSGARALTPDFAAPEQLTGEVGTTAIDVYALGVLLYLLLSGSHPTAGSAETRSDRFRHLLEAEPPPLSTAVRADAAAARGKPAAALGRLYAGDLDSILARALQKRPADRYPGVDAFADDLRRYLQSEPVHARPTTVTYRAGRFLRRHRASLAAGAVAALLVTAGATTIWRQLLAARRERDAAVEQARRSDRLTASLLLQAAQGAAGHAGSDRATLDRADSLAVRGGDAALEARVACALAGWHAARGDLDSSRVELTRARGLAAALPAATAGEYPGCDVPGAATAPSAPAADSSR